MKEVTRITNLQITEVFVVDDERVLSDKTEYGKEIAVDVENIFCVDNVAVIGEVQEFVRDV